MMKLMDNLTVLNEQIYECSIVKWIFNFINDYNFTVFKS